MKPEDITIYYSQTGGATPQIEFVTEKNKTVKVIGNFIGIIEDE